jgi:hypothetical protein
MSPPSAGAAAVGAVAAAGAVAVAVAGAVAVVEPDAAGTTATSWIFGSAFLTTVTS